MKYLPLALCITFIGSLTLAPDAQAQKVYRCGNHYSQTPCAGGDSTEIPVNDARTPEQKRDIERATARNAQAADALERSRLKQEEEWQKSREAEQKKAAANQALEKKRQLLEAQKAEKLARHKSVPQPPELQKPKAPPKSKAAPSDDFRAVHRPPKS